ncbi:amylo-alpha-1,6-glucosidase [Glaciihabitans arcticus]|uniref:Amylo-alpha-1,6-glucosidase n=1 Tax=Glaciihabitans arcticus TaxID=2668039 RepID=A0A4Q9GV20_9MICO|nr:glycogen debranching N-terminal domain-containing protein [Glaciihabitans arcticus]TBN58641.1 amylo-alpha-1,6-glucosidase [Glaciihabitans arcticus]
MTHQPMQPLLHDATVVLKAPTQAWSAEDGSIGSAPIHGIYFSDVRIVALQSITVGGETPEHIATAAPHADSARFIALVRGLDDPSPDPGVRVEHRRESTTSGVNESVAIQSRRDIPIETTIEIELRVDATAFDLVKAGLGSGDLPVVELREHGAAWQGNGVSVELRADDARVSSPTTGVLRITADVTVPPRGSATVEWALTATDELSRVTGVSTASPWSTTVSAGDERLGLWVDRALGDLDALRMATGGGEFVAAGAPWFLTLFGRDSIWTARFLLPLGTGIARSTLRILADLQGTESVAATAEQPGKIMHELRRQVLSIPGESVEIPPLYYGTVDATALWICLLHDTWRWGMPDAEVEALLPNLEAALAWMRDFGDADGDGLLEYVDETGHGLANQGWKDSGDSVQWRDGTLADGPIALCEVQAYAYEAATHGADLLEAFGRDGSEWRAWAARLRENFGAFWIDDDRGGYPAIALDATKRRVDTVTSNLGHLLGTGILTEAQSATIAARLVSPELSSGFGLRTMSTDSAGYWPLSYHGGSVWTHDTAIAISGLVRDGHRNEARELIEGLLAAASAFDYRLPELHSGDSSTELSRPVPYPAACRPQAWSAASAVSVLGSILGLDVAAGSLVIDPDPSFGRVDATGLRYRDAPVTLP